MAKKTTFELIDDIKKNVPRTHGGRPVVVCFEDLDNLTMESIFLDLTDEGKVQGIKVVMVEEHDLDDSSVWISTLMHSNTETFQTSTRQQFGKDSRNLDQILDFIKTSLKNYTVKF